MGIDCNCSQTTWDIEEIKEEKTVARKETRRKKQIAEISGTTE